MSLTPSYLVDVGAEVPAVLSREWQGLENSVRWTESIPVSELREFMEALPGDPISPTGQEIIDQHLVLEDDGNRMVVLVPIRLRGSEMIWGLVLVLTVDEMGPDGQPDWLTGLGPQTLLTSDELAALARA